MTLLEASDENLVRLRLITHNAKLVDSRKERSMTQRDLVAATGIPFYRVHSIETLKKNPTDDEMARIACVLEKPTDYLFPEELFPAVEAGVFSWRKAELRAPQVISLTEAKWHHLLPASGQHELEEVVARAILTDLVKEAVGTLDAREQRVLSLRFGLGEERPSTLEEIGNMPEFGLHRESLSFCLSDCTM